MEDLKTILFNKQYMLKRRISSGSFGVVFRGIDTTSSKIVALKLEELKKKEDEIRSVQREGSFLKRLEGVQGVPELYWSGTEHGYDVIAI